MASDREAPLVRAMMRHARAEHCWVKKNHGSLYGLTGEPDLLILIPVPYQTYAVPVFVEVKSAGGSASKLQKMRLVTLQRVGAIAECVDSLEKFKALIASVKVGAGMAADMSQMV